MLSRVIIVGAGAMGCLFAARLASAGVSVTLVDVDQGRLAALREHGLLLRDDDGEKRTFPGAELAADVTGPIDLVMIFTKGVHTRAAIASIAHLVDSAPLALTLQNGVGNGEIIAELFGPDRVIVGTAHVPAELELPNTVVTHGFAHLHMGSFSKEGNADATDIADTMRQAGFKTTLSDDVHADIWEKLAFNAALNPLAMIARASNGMMNNEHGRSVAHRIVAETVAVAAAKGIALDEAGIVATVDRALTEHSHHKASMLQDHEAGRPTEIAFINGAVIREGARLGIDTPANETLSSIVQLIETQSG